MTSPESPLGKRFTNWPVIIVLLWMTAMNPQQSYAAPALQQEATPRTGALIYALSELLDELNVPHAMNLESIAAATQRWRRQPGQERWEMPDIKLDFQRQERVMAHLEKLGLVKELRPKSREFEYALLLGATAPRMENRLQQLAKLWRDGVRFNEIIFLVGQRPLTPGIDQVETLVARILGREASTETRKNARPMTETEAAVMVYEVTDLPEAMRKVPVHYVDTPRFWQENHWQRANTRDTLKKWLERADTSPGKTLIISDQPHALYQQEVVRQELPTTSFPTEVTGQQAGVDTRIAVYLDALALWLHNLQNRLSAHGYSN